MTRTSERRKPLSPSSDKALDRWERLNEIRSDDEPDLNLRAKTQTVSEGILRYMGEEFLAPERYALGLVGAGEVEQIIDDDRPVVWMQSAPGPKEADRGANATQGSRESGDPDIVVGEQKVRQQTGAEEATNRQRQLDQTREHGEPGGSALSSEDQMEGFATLGERGGDRDMSEREERRGRGEEREERWMQRLITEQQETIDTQSETIERLVKMVGEEEEDEERSERRRRRRGEDEDEGRRGRRGRY